MKSSTSQEKISSNQKKYTTSGFYDRLRELYPNIKQKEIADIIGVSASAITLYKKLGRLPETGRIVEIASNNQVSLHWLTIGQGPKWADDLAGLPRPNTDQWRLEMVLPIRLPYGIYQSLLTYSKLRNQIPEDLAANIILRALVQEGILTINSFRS